MILQQLDFSALKCCPHLYMVSHLVHFNDDLMSPQTVIYVFAVNNSFNPYFFTEMFMGHTVHQIEIMPIQFFF